MMKLENPAYTTQTEFRQFNDNDIGIDISKFESEYDEELCVEAYQDDDLESDCEVLNAGTQQCFQDLLVVKETLNIPFEIVRRKLKTFRIWAPAFNGTLPYVQQ